jgi:integrative and conjugative element protein (TIGR02256 family)
MASRTFLLPGNRGHVIFVDKVLKHLYRHTQTHFWHREAGGQLFSNTPHEASVVVCIATGPHPQDSRSRFHFTPNLTSATVDRQTNFNLGIYAVGLWHTHPEANPKPSIQDYNTTREYLDAFHGIMNGFLLVIIGNYGNPLNMAVWLATLETDNSWIKLQEV